MTIKIEKNIEVPFDWRNSINPFRDALEKMEVDDSFSYNVTDESSVRSVINSIQKKCAKKFITRKMTENSRRAWRTK